MQHRKNQGIVEITNTGMKIIFILLLILPMISCGTEERSGEVKPNLTATVQTTNFAQNT